MAHPKNIAFFLLMVFCTNTLLATKSTSAYFSAKDFKVVGSHCPNLDKASSKENGKKFTTAPESDLSVCIANCPPVFCLSDTALSIADLPSPLPYIYFPKLNKHIALDNPLPPPQVILG